MRETDYDKWIQENPDPVWDGMNGGGMDGGGDATLKADVTPLVRVDVAAWIGAPIPPREWAVLNRVPHRAVTLFSGNGGVGKSIVAMMLGAAHVLAKDWFGAMPEPGPVIYFSTEDDEKEMHRRFARIAEHYDASLADLANDLHLFDRVGKDNILGAPGHNGIIRPTPLLDQLRETACDLKPKLIILDALADIFAGSENDRAQNRQFLALLRGVAISANTAVLLIAHPSLTGMNTGTGLSGVTDWHNAVRGRMYLTSAKASDDTEPDPDLRTLEVLKANYGPTGERVLVRWRDGVYIPEPTAGSLEKLAAERKADDLFMTMLDRFTGQGRNVSDKRSPSYAPALFAKEPDAKTQGIAKAVLEDAMRRLFAAGRIRVETSGRPSHQRSKLVRTAHD
jgi:RecA-family ATPase